MSCSSSKFRHCHLFFPASFSTDLAFITSGNSATYQIFTALSTGAERGSNAVTVMRPV